MKDSDGAFHECYKAQASLNEDSQVIVVAELSALAPDAPRSWWGALDQLDDNLEAIGLSCPPGRR